jgi:large repetitive protein
VHKGIYRLYQLTPNGSWKKIYEVQNNTTTIVSPANTIGDLTLTDANNNLMYYIFKVDVENPCGLLNNDSYEFNLTDSLIPKPVISGPRIVCRTYDVIFSTPSNVGSTYSWITTGSNATVVSGATTNSVTLRWANNQSAGVKEIKVAENNGLFTREVVYKVNVKAIPTPNIVITPNSTSICTNQNITLSTFGTGNSFTWNVGNGIISSGDGTNKIMVSWPTDGARTISVTESNGGCSGIANLLITVIQQPNPIITGSTTICEGQQLTLTCNTANPANNFNWSLSGGVIVNQNANTVEAYWPTSGTYAINVTEDNGSCIIISQTFMLTVLVSPSPVITGPINPNTGSTVLYSVVTPVATNTYTWLLTSGGTILAGQGTSTIKVEWAVAGQPENVDVTEDNKNCSASAVSYSVMPI